MHIYSLNNEERKGEVIMLQLDAIVGGYNEEFPIIKNVSFDIKKGRMVGILGPNGCGKSTLLKLISGILPLKKGSVRIDGELLQSYSARELARKMAVLPQLHNHSFSHTVRETVALGRYPHQRGIFSSWSTEDEESVRQSMRQTGVEQYENEDITYLSGGEQQRTFVAQSLAQKSALLLLDEPTNHLDIEHQKQLMDMIQHEVKINGLTVVSVFHDMNLAALYCDELILMADGQIVSYGEPHEVLKEKQVEKVYHTKIAQVTHPAIPKPQISLLPSTYSQVATIVTKEKIKIFPDYVLLITPEPLKVVSSALHNAGIGWYDTFMNRCVDQHYMCSDAHVEMEQYIQAEGFMPSKSVAMMTAVAAKHAIINEYEEDGLKVVVVVTAGVGNAVDASKSYLREPMWHIGTINMWIFINGILTDESLLQAMMTATEAKVKAMADEQIIDQVSGTIATGTSTDSMLVAATQQGELQEYAGTVTKAGRLIGRGVYETTVEALLDYKRAKGLI